MTRGSFITPFSPPNLRLTIFNSLRIMLNTSYMSYFPASHILYGSDYPFVEGSHSIDELDAYPLSVAMRTAIDRENALALLPRLKEL